MTRNVCDDCKCPARTTGAFCSLPKPEIRVLARGKTMNTYRRRNTIFYEGNPSLGVYCVRSGKVKIYKQGADGKVQIVRLAKSGDLLGYRAFFAEEPYCESAEVLETSCICFIDRATITQLLARNVQLAQWILKKICIELRQARERNLALAQKSVPQRVAELLIALHDSFGENTPQGTKVNISLTREEMAELAGTRTETLIRTLSGFKKRGLVEIAPPHIYVKSVPGLKKLFPLAG